MLKRLWSILRSSFWFVPSLIVTVSIVLAVSFSVVLAMGGIGVLIFFIHQIRSNAKGDVAIMLRLLGALQIITGLTDSPKRRRALGAHARWRRKNCAG